jgi:3'-phosphoadenosine 5'-phosphosulfate sulfotransferase (PAPS reductase)/FAD synthetase
MERCPKMFGCVSAIPDLSIPPLVRFVADFQINYDVPVHWLEYRPGRTFAEVTYETASRNGEPFSYLLDEVTSLPNPRARRCTTQLKMRTMKRWLVARGIHDHYKVIGLRADEPMRVSRMRGDTQEEVPLMPLAEASVTKLDVDTFWRSNSFDLNLPFDSNLFGNCVGCF